jgi:poly-gamma-glutamate synthesis protein (capsule biosynthesis protein)
MKKLNKKRTQKILFLSLILTTAILIAVGLFYLSNQQNTTISFFDKIINKELKEEKIEILFVGDLMFDRGIRYYANKGGGNDFIFEKIKPELLKYDLVVATLEGPITNNQSVSSGTVPGSKYNYFFTMDPSVAETLKKHNIGLVNIGNNHILDFGAQGLLATKKYLENANVGYFGEPDGQKSIIKDFNNIRIAFIGYNEFYRDERQSSIDEVKKLKPLSDIVIVYCHWGIEYQKKPTNAQKELAYKFIDAGADFVVGSHPHVIQTTEEYKGKKIYYSLGNFIFDQHFSEDVRRGLGVILEIKKNSKELRFNEINFYLQSNGQTIIENP